MSDVPLRDMLSNAIGYWERGRLVYNAVLVQSQMRKSTRSGLPFQTTRPWRFGHERGGVQQSAPANIGIVASLLARRGCASSFGHGQRMNIASSLRGVLVAVMLALCGCGFNSSDASLEKNFQQRRVAFEALLRMAQKDQHMSRIAPDFTWLTNDLSWPRENIGISAKRWSEYRRLFKETGVENGVLRPERSEIIFFIVEANGLVTGGDSKGYAFSKGPVSPILTSLDNAAGRLQSSEPGYKSLGSGWYLYYDWDD